MTPERLRQLIEAALRTESYIDINPHEGVVGQFERAGQRPVGALASSRHGPVSACQEFRNRAILTQRSAVSFRARPSPSIQLVPLAGFDPATDPSAKGCSIH